MEVRDMGFGRTVTGLAALSIAAFYLLFTGSLTSNFKWMCIAAILILTFSWITMDLCILRHKGRFGTQSISDIIFMCRGVTF